jgi:Fur family transcriptional regulator, peroxide stress response regulator
MLNHVLEAKGLRPTSQRVVILDYLQHIFNHPTAEEVFEAVQEKLPVKLSKATLYNTLNSLVEVGLVKTVSVEAGKIRYDANIEAHHHFVDTSTGVIHDIPWEKVSELCESLGSGYQIQDYSITFFGLKNPHSA